MIGLIVKWLLGHGDGRAAGFELTQSAHAPHAVSQLYWY